MGETGFKCPECGQTSEFDAHAVVLSGTTRITAYGWNYFDFANDVGLADGALMTCCECGHMGEASDFEE